MYVDDLITGEETIEGAYKLKKMEFQFLTFNEENLRT